MQALEYYFNPRLRKDVFFEVFSFKPDTYQKKYLGNLYLIVELDNVLQKDRIFLEKLGKLIRDEFYSSTTRLPEISLKEALKKANQFLDNKINQGEIRWLGNLNVAVLSISNFFLYFSKAGNIKILLLRGDELLDISENLEMQAGSSTPFKFFSSIASGRLAASDKIMVLTQRLFEEFYDEVLPSIINLPKLDDKTLKKFFRERKKEIKDYSGVFFLASAEGEKQRFRFQLRLPLINKILLLILILFLILLISYFIFR
jgi:hypothetical protein